MAEAIDISIRPMRAADMDQVMQLLSRWNLAPLPPSREIPDPERQDLVVANTIVAEDAGRIVGVRSFIQHTAIAAEGASLAVDPAYQQHGIATALAKVGWRIMWQRGIRKIRSETDRPEVVKWLVRDFGYRVVGTTAKRHAFGIAEVDQWTVLELELEERLFLDFGDTLRIAGKES